MLPDCLLPDGAPCRTAHADRVLDVNDMSMLPVLQLPNLLVDPACDAWLVLCSLLSAAPYLGRYASWRRFWMHETCY